MFSTGDDAAARLRHELHTPLTSILAYTRLLRDDLTAPSPGADGAACLDAIDRNAVRLQRYVDRVVLPLAASDAPAQPRQGVTDLVAVLRDAVDLARRVAVAGAVSIHADAPVSVPVAVDELVCRHLVGQLVLWLATSAPARAHTEISLRADPVPTVEARTVPPGDLTAPQPRPASQNPVDLRVAGAVASLCGGDVRLDETTFHLTLPASALVLHG